jgi:hypothetical protein
MQFHPVIYLSKISINPGRQSKDCLPFLWTFGKEEIEYGRKVRNVKSGQKRQKPGLKRQSSRQKRQNRFFFKS